MESIIARALEYTLKYWLKSFSRDQFKLQGRTAQLSNLDINGDAIHSSVGLPPALNVVTAKVGKLEIKLPYVSNVQIEPIVVEIDRLDVVLKENSDEDTCRSSNSPQSSTSSGKGSGYGYADKIADGMTLVVGTVNLLIEPRGGAQGQGGATWASPLASITIRNLSLYTTNENWQVVSLKEARDFSYNKKCIYVFKKLEWESLSIDLLPHPDMFTDADLMGSKNGEKRDDDGAKRVFFGGERFLEGISGHAHITVQRTDLNSPLGLEVQLHVSEATCPALSEPGLRALLRFMTGLYVCLNRGDVDPASQQRSTEAAGCSLVSIIVDHIFLCIKDAEFQLELLMQSLFFSRASVSDKGKTKNLSCITIGGLFLRDTFSHPPCTLVQPLMHAVTKDSRHVPDFAENFCPPIYPLGDQQRLNESIPVLCLHSLQMKPSPSPPTFASQTVINCQPLMINLQEEACLRISSFLADGIVVNPGAVLPDSSIDFLVFNLKKLDLTVFLDAGKSDNCAVDGTDALHRSFAGARLHIEDLLFSESPALKLRLLNLDKDPACFCLWEDQPVDASQKKWTTRASKLSLSLETCSSLKESQSNLDWSEGLWRCVELNEVSIEAAMATADGSPIKTIPPPGGIVRIGVACQQYLSNTSVEQLFFVLDLYTYLGRVSEKIAIVGKSKRQEMSRMDSLGGRLMEKVPSDTAVSLQMGDLQLRFLETSSTSIEGVPLVQFVGEDLFVKVSHRTLGGAMAVSSSVRWESVHVDCVDADGYLNPEKVIIEIPNGNAPLIAGNGHPHMRAVFWINNKGRHHQNIRPVPFLEINTVHVMPYNAQDSECHTLSVSTRVAGVRLGGGMNYAEALLHRFGILGPDGGPGEGLSKGLKNLSAGPLSKLLRASPHIKDEIDQIGISEDGEGGGFLDLGKPDDVDVSIELKDWLFALEGAQEIAERWWFDGEDISREEKCWHTMFQSLQVKAKSNPKHVVNGTGKSVRIQKYPVQLVTVGVEGLQALKPQSRKDIHQTSGSLTGIKSNIINSGGVDLEARMVISSDKDNVEMPDWVVENLKFSVKQPIEAVATKEELQHLAVLCKSEVDSMGRIAAGILRVLKLDTSIGQGAIDQLSNLGSDGMDKIFTPEKLSRHSTARLTPSSNMINGPSPNQSLESTVASLEAAVLDSQAKCSMLVDESSTILSASHLSDIKQLSQKLESMQILLTRLRTQI
ncbi:AAA+ ATPase domain-containing protein [Thalictrum thalictroides]|uniref:AAA+ ATPase domain-containing protein n=1 Tax=Thalictrum thalictroides TaxID=46969 RepID=A0A7J6VI83_THATH|nr:AAA+ ATPase domain-containing protein [Thalictrum thalictroides]